MYVAESTGGKKWSGDTVKGLRKPEGKGQAPAAQRPYGFLLPCDSAVFRRCSHFLHLSVPVCANEVISGADLLPRQF